MSRRLNGARAYGSYAFDMSVSVALMPMLARTRFPDRADAPVRRALNAKLRVPSEGDKVDISVLWHHIPVLPESDWLSLYHAGAPSFCTEQAGVKTMPGSEALCTISLPVRLRRVSLCHRGRRDLRIDTWRSRSNL